jgi:methionyl-tRNA formyltransferase
MRIAFMGSPEISSTIFNNLINKGLKIDAVITQPDRPCGRGCKVKESPLKSESKKQQVKVYEPQNKESLVDVIKNLKPDLCIVAAYGMIIPKEALDIPRYGMINFHPSLLPELRGPSPIPMAILSGLKETGVTIMQVSEKMDAGDILTQEKINLKGSETTPTLSENLAHIGSRMILDLIPKIEQKNIKPIKQDDKKATYTRIIKKEDGLINWATQSAAKIERMSRAYQPWPGVYTTWDGKKIDFYEITKTKVHLEPGLAIEKNNRILIGTCNGTIALGYLKIEGKKRVTAREFICGYPRFINFQLKD